MAGKRTAPKSGAKVKAGVVKKITVPAISIARMLVTLVGYTRLVVNRFPKKAAMQMLKKQMQEKVVREKRNPELEFREAQYLLPPKKRGGKKRQGFPSCGIKEAMATAAKRFLGIDKVAIYGNLYIHGEPCISDFFSSRDCVELRVVDPKMRTDIVKLQGPGNPPDFRYRPEFLKWETDLVIDYDPDVLTPETIMRLLHVAGQKVGLGEWRIERGGEWGRFGVKGIETKVKGKGGSKKKAVGRKTRTRKVA